MVLPFFPYYTGYPVPCPAKQSCAVQRAAQLLLYRLLFEAVLQGHAAVEHQVIRRAVPVIHAEIARAHELERRRVDAGAVLLAVERGGDGGHLGLDLTAGQHRQRLRVQAVEEVLVRAVGLGVGN